MSKLPVIPKYLYLALILVLVTLVLVVVPVHVAAGSRTAGQLTGPSREVLAGWPSSPSESGQLEALPVYRGMRVWLPPARPVGAPPVRPLLDPVKRVQIESPIGTQISTKSLTADQNFTFHAVGYNGVTSTQEVTWTLSAAIGTLSTGRGESTTLDATKVGSADLRAQLVSTPSVSTTARITVTPGAAHHIVVRTGANNSGAVAGNHAMTTDETWPLYAAGYDADNNYVGDLSVSWSVTGDNIGVVAPTTGASTVLDARRPGTGRVRADHATVIDGETGEIDVSVGAPSYITIRTGANNGGAPAGDHTMTTDEVWQLYAAGYDADNNYIADLEVDWSVTGGIGAVAPARASATTLDARRLGTGRVLANHVTAVDDETGDITVSVGALHHILIRTAAGGSGVEVGDHTMTIYETYTMWAAGYDADNNFRGDVPAAWVLDGLAGALQPASGTSTTFRPAPVRDDSGRIRASYSGVSDQTGNFTIRAPELSISKSDDLDPVPAGAYLQYTIVFTNTGNAAAQSVRITETYDSNVTFVGAGPPPLAGTNNVWTLGTLGIGASSTIYVTVQVDGSLEPNTLLNNEVTIGGLRLGQVTDTENTTVQSAPDLVLTLTDQPDPVYAGANLVYRIHYTNQGNAPVRNARVVMAYDDHVSFVSSNPSPDAGTDNRWSLGRVEGGVSGDIYVTVRVDTFMLDQEVVASSATIRSDNTTPYGDSEGTTVNAPALVLTKVDAPDPVVALDPLVYTLVYTNVGHAAAPALNITDVVPANTSYVSCRGLPCSYSSSDRIVTWRNDSGLAAGASRSLTLVVNVDRNLDTGTLLTNRARVRVVDEPAYAAVAEIGTTVVSSPSLSLSINNGQSTVEAGDDLVYVVSYNNDGTGRAYGTTIAVTPPSGQYVEDVGCDPPSACQLQGGQVIFNIGTLPSGSGGSGTVRMVATVRDPLPAGARSITASAEIRTDTPGDPPGDNSAQDVDPIATRPDLQLQVDYHNHTPYPGKRITYTLQYSNKGHIATTGVGITASLPNHATYEQDGSSAWKAAGNGDYVYTVGPLDYNQGGALLFVVTLPTGIFTTDMCSFDAAFEIGDSGISGEDANPSSNVALAPLGVADMVVEDVEVNWRSLLSGEYGPHITATLRNRGSVWACNSIPGPDDPPDFCAGFWVDVYFNPSQVPPSYPSDTYYGQIAEAGIKIPPNSTVKVPFVFDSVGILTSLGDPSPLYIRVDNLDANPERPFGSVPECNELNNVFGPVQPLYDIYMPVVMKGR